MIDHEYNLLLISESNAILYWVQVESVYMNETTHTSVLLREVSPTGI